MEGPKLKGGGTLKFLGNLKKEKKRKKKKKKKKEFLRCVKRDKV
jgi:hypothetical protein